MNFFSYIYDKAVGLANTFLSWWNSLNVVQQGGTTVGVCIFGVSAFIGGVVLQATFVATMFNAALFWLMRDSLAIKRFINKHSVKIDVGVSLLSFIFNPLPGVAGAFISIMTGIMFSVFRTVCCTTDRLEDGIVIDAEAEVVEPVVEPSVEPTVEDVVEDAEEVA
jgi:hypothetical protein